MQTNAVIEMTQIQIHLKTREHVVDQEAEAQAEPGAAHQDPGLTVEKVRQAVKMMKPKRSLKRN